MGGYFFDIFVVLQRGRNGKQKYDTHGKLDVHALFSSSVKNCLFILTTIGIFCGKRFCRFFCYFSAYTLSQAFASKLQTMAKKKR